MKKHRIVNIVVKLLIGTERKVNDMPRYIDADALIRVLDAKADMAMGTPKEVFLSVAKMIDYLPTADVVPRAEVAREIFAEIEKIRAKEIRKCEHFRQKENDASERKY